MVSWKRTLCQVFSALAVLLYFHSQALCFTGSLPSQKVSWNIQARQVSYDNKSKRYIAEDEVVITGGQTRIETDYVEFSDDTKEAFAKGHVLFISGKDTITCESMQVNLAKETGIIHNGTIFLQDGNYYISGQTLRKTGEFTYDAVEGTITTCSGDQPDWKITGKDIEVTIDGYGRTSHATLWAKKMPLLYSPYFIFPAKTTRQTGLLLPMAGNSDSKGIEYQQPLFLALSDSMDATLYSYYMSDRGVMLSGEYRYMLPEESRGMIMADYLKDDTIGDGTNENEDYSFATTPDRTNQDRYWIRMKHDQNLGYGFNAKLDIDYVSDADFLLDFQDGFTGYDETDAAFAKMFGRDIDEYNDYTRKNSLLVTRNWSAYSLNMQALWYDNVKARQTDADDTTLQTLPSLTLDGVRQKIGPTGLYYKMNTQLKSFYRQDTTATKVNGQRMDIHPTFYYPVKLGKSLFFEPYAGIRGTFWHTDDFCDDDGDDSDTRSRGLYELGMDLSISLNRVFTLNTDFAEKIKHEIVPKLEYDYIPDVDQEDLPYFDSLDDISEKNVITWSLTHTFTSRRTVFNDKKEASSVYKELLWLKLFQEYDIRYERDKKNAQDDPWQDLTLKYELNPSGYLTAKGTVAFDPNTRDFTRFWLGGTLRDKRQDSIYTAYRYTEDTLHTWYTKFNINLLSNTLQAYYSFEKDLEDKSTIETCAGFIFNRPCWALRLGYKKESDDKSFTFMVTLKGIGEFGTQ